MKAVVPVVIFLLISSATRADIESLNGFKLWQYKSAVRRSLGEPFKTIALPDALAEAHGIGGEAYMVFEYSKEWPDNATAIQITGTTASMVPFEGLQLGDDRTKVLEKLGEPAATRKPVDPDVEVLEYDSFNGSVEIDADGRLYSIKINVTDEIMNLVSEGESDPSGPVDSLTALTAALNSRNVGRILDTLRPDVEVYLGGETLTIDRRFSDFANEPTEAFMEALIGKEKSLQKAIAESDPELHMRLTEKMGMGLVYKFDETSIVKEVALFPYNGEFRIYEISFNDGAAEVKEAVSAAAGEGVLTGAQEEPPKADRK